MQPCSSSSPFTPPLSLINLKMARERFGEQAVNLLIEMAHTGDTRADAVIQETEVPGLDVKRQLKVGIKEGLDSLPHPSPGLRTFLEETERLPDWVEPHRLEHGSQAFLSIGPIWRLLALGAGSLTHTYTSPAIAKVLVGTGNLTRMAHRRLMETGLWHIEVHLPGGLRCGANGYIHTLEVRLLHARIRKTLLSRGWDQHATGLPINQLDMLRTWLDFTYVPFTALCTYGIAFSPRELEDLYHFWQYIAHLLGIDERLYRRITDQKQANELLALISSTEEAPASDSRVLMQHMLDALAILLHQNGRLPRPLAFDFVCAFTRRLHGDKLADQLGIPKTWLGSLLPLLVQANRARRAWQTRSPSARQHKKPKTVEDLRDQ